MKFSLWKKLTVAGVFIFGCAIAHGSGVSFPSTYKADAVVVTGGTINGTSVGAIVPASGSFTTLNANAGISGTGAAITGVPIATGLTGLGAGVVTVLGRAIPANSFSFINQVMHVRDEKAVGTAGGASALGANTRVLNASVINTITGASLAANQITLPAGVYRVRGSAPSHGANRHKGYLFNVTAGALSIAGSSEFNTSASGVSTSSTFNGSVTLAAAAVFEVRQYIQTAVAGNGLGVETNDAAAGVEIYTQIWIEKE